MVDKQLFEQSFLITLYHDELSGQSIVMDERTGRLYVKKVLNWYHKEIFDYIMHHPNLYLAQIYAYEENESELTVIENYIPGETLDIYLREKRPTKAQRMHLFSEICKGVASLHRCQPAIIHRDLKMSNIMITDDGVVKIIDYDAAKPYTPNQERDTELIGTQGMAAPEQYGFGASDVRTDIYGLGMIMREMFNDDSEFGNIIEKATEMNPKDRYQTVDELMLALKKCQDNSLEWSDEQKVDILKKMGIPGFRSGNKVNETVAILGYLLILLIVYIIEPVKDMGIGTLIAEKIIFFGWCISVVALVTGWHPVLKKLPFMNSHHFIVRMISVIMWSALFFIIWLFIEMIIRYCMSLVGIV